MMPGMDGFELLRALRSDPELDFVPVILLTAKASLDSRVSGLGLGADDYLAKPVQGREFDARVDNIIASRRRLRARFANEAPAVPAIIASATTPAPLGDQSVTLKLESERALFLDRVRTAIAGHIGDEDYGPDALAADVGQSRRTLFRRVEELMGLSPMELIWKVRLDTAARLLDQKEGSVSEIAYGVGFKSVAHFSKKFRAAHGTTPSKYRGRSR
jgi:AraC-like DNA-binding protein